MSKANGPQPTKLFDRVKRIRVAGLFGVFDHEISVRPDARITVIHGPNGVGKTIVLRMIREVLSGKPDVIERIPFTNFQIEFLSGDRILIGHAQDVDPAGQESKLVYEAVINSKHQAGKFAVGFSASLARQVARYLGPNWHYVGDEKWEDRTDGEIRHFDQMRRHLPPRLLNKADFEKDPFLDELFKKCRVRFIGTNRLLSGEFGADYGPELEYEVDPEGVYLHRARRRDLEQRTIARYSADLVSRIGRVLSDYAKLAEELDRTMVRRLLDKPRQASSPLKVFEDFKELDQKRKRFTGSGLLTETEDVLGRRSDQEFIELFNRSQDVFSLYVSDMQKKLSLLDQMQDKMQLLLHRINERFRFKKLTISTEKGFVFTSDAGNELSASDLSSGEQHEMILFYELLFLVQDGDLILLDEPEISLHVEWQIHFLDDVDAALGDTNTQLFVATHAPAIAQGAGDSLVSLGSDL